jgi:hypothetical protein
MLAFTNLEGEHCRCHAAAIRKHDNPLARLEITKWNKKGKHQFSSMSIRTEESRSAIYTRVSCLLWRTDAKAA